MQETIRGTNSKEICRAVARAGEPFGNRAAEPSQDAVLFECYDTLEFCEDASEEIKIERLNGWITINLRIDSMRREHFRSLDGDSRDSAGAQDAYIFSCSKFKSGASSKDGWRFVEDWLAFFSD